MMLPAQNTRQAKSMQKTTISVQEVQSESSSSSSGSGVGAGVGAGDGGQVPWMTPHSVDSHRVSSNAYSRFTSLFTHQPRSCSNDEASSNILYISVTFSTLQPPRSWSNDKASLNMDLMLVTPEVSHAPMSSLKEPS